MNRSFFQFARVPLLVAIIFAVLTWPIWRWLWNEWMANAYYSHGLLIPAVALLLAVQRFRNDKSLRTVSVARRQGSNFGLLLVAVSLVALVVFLNDKAYYLAALAMIGLIGGLIWSLGGTQLARKLAFPTGYLALMVPLPVVERATLPLALFTGVCSGGLVRWLGMDVTIVGNAVTLPNANLVIGAQCSGINSLIALTSLMALAAYLLDGPLGGRLTLVVLAVPLAMLGNILRVASLLLVARLYGADAAFVFYHDYSGIAFFVVVMLLMLPLARLLHARTLRFDVI